MFHQHYMRSDIIKVTTHKCVTYENENTKMQLYLIFQVLMDERSLVITKST